MNLLVLSRSAGEEGAPTQLGEVRGQELHAVPLRPHAFISRCGRNGYLFRTPKMWGEDTTFPYDTVANRTHLVLISGNRFC